MSKKSILVPAALLLAAVPPSAPAAAQSDTTSTVFYACYVPGTGTVYRIRETDLRQSCASRGHTEFSWTDGATGARRPVGGVTDHGQLTGLADDDHPQYFRTDGSRAFTADLSLGGFRITNLAPGTEAGDALRFDQALKSGDAVAGDLAGALPGPTVAKLRGRSIAETAPTDGQMLAWSESAQQWRPTTPVSGGSGGTSDHGALAGLADDDHPQYLLANGSRILNGNLVVAERLTAARAALGSSALATSGALAAGANTQALFGGSIALGSNAVASAVASVAFTGAIASAERAFGAGLRAKASGMHSFALGYESAAAQYAHAFGFQAVASGSTSTAIGPGANTNGFTGAITVNAGNGTFFANREREFAVHAPGGIRMMTRSDIIMGCYINPGAGTWNCTSDRNAKQDFADIDGAELLEKIDAMPIQSWSYRTEAGVRHIGPTAQDFRAAFGLGPSDTDIGLIDAAGVSLAGVKQLSRDVRTLRTENRVLRAEQQDLRTRLEALEARVAKLEEGR